MAIFTETVTTTGTTSTSLVTAYIPGAPPLPTSSAELVGLLTGPPNDPSPYNESVIHPYRRVDIHNADDSIWMASAPFVSGSVNVDYNRDERRQGDLVLNSLGGDLRIDPREGVWYDKIIKLYRGIYVNGSAEPQYWQVGEMMIDRLTYTRDGNIAITMRDMTKAMMTSKFSRSTSFPTGTEISIIIKSLAFNSGITKLQVASTTKTTGKMFVFERNTSRWEAAKEVASSYGYELYFNGAGYLVMRPFVDPVTAPVSLKLIADGRGYNDEGDLSNVGDYTETTSDSRLYNHVVVTGESAGVVSAFAEVRNTGISSPTSVARIKERSYFYTSSFIQTNAQAFDVAYSFLKIHALEQFDVSVGAGVYPWLEAGEAMSFESDSAIDTLPTRFLLTNFSIPMGLADMEITAARVAIVEDVDEVNRTVLDGSSRLTTQGHIRLLVI